MAGTLCDWLKDNADTIQAALEYIPNLIRKFQAWYDENSETLSDYIAAFLDFGIWTVAINKLIENHIVFTDYLSNEFAREIFWAENVDLTISEYYFGDGHQSINAVISRCKDSELLRQYNDLFGQIIAAYRNKHYQLACLGLYAIIDGSMSLISEDNTTSFKSRISKIKRKIGEKVELNDVDRRFLCIYSALKSFDQSAFCNSSFYNGEPDCVNRHWDMHGRTRRSHTELDFLKVLLWVDALVYIDGLNRCSNGDAEEMV